MHNLASEGENIVADYSHYSWSKTPAWVVRLFIVKALIRLLRYVEVPL